MIDESNPAGRLYKILKTAKGYVDTEKVRNVWSSVFGIDDDDLVITKSVVELYSLSQEVQSLIKMNENLNHSLYLSSFNNIDRSFFPLNLNANWSNCKPHLTDEALTRLQFCAEELSRFYSEETISEEELTDIVKKTNELFDSLLASSLPDVLRLTLLEEVEKIRNAISMYKIKGAKGLKQALQGTLGAIITNHDALRAESTQNQDVLHRLGELIDKLDSFAARALKLNKLISSPIKFVLEKLTAPDNEMTVESIDSEREI